QPRIIAVTANAIPSDRELCLNAGMDDYVSKPVRVEELIAALERCAAVLPDYEEDPPAARVEADPVDREVLARFQASLGDDGAIVLELIDLFLQDTPRLLAELGSALIHDDVATARRVAHTLKSSSASLGAQALAERCQDLELLAESGSLDGGAEQAREI